MQTVTYSDAHFGIVGSSCQLEISIRGLQVCLRKTRPLLKDFFQLVGGVQKMSCIAANVIHIYEGATVPVSILASLLLTHKHNNNSEFHNIIGIIHTKQC